ncbi:carbohydrate-binding protein [Paenibacillus sp.]|uniref:carbohydrate-binding protein n=1 Tax=Paenibacillus sp. TaxID=58172 RepID=UPI002812214C|nr:carbohydrate-binding protein [Paenibacillus sp.]
MIRAIFRNRWLHGLLAAVLLLQLTARAPAAVAEDESVALTFEAEAEANALTGKATVNDCDPAAGCSGGRIVGNLWGGSTLRFQDVVVPEAGIYTMTVRYISGDPRSVAIGANGAPGDRFDLPSTGSWSTLGSYELEIELAQGANSILFDDGGGYAPDIDRIDLEWSREPGTDPGEEPPGEPSGDVYEAEDPVNTLTGNAGVRACKASSGCSGGSKVGDLWGGSSLRFNGVAAPTDGVYLLKLSYISGDPRPIAVTVNEGAEETYTPPATADWDTVGTFSIEAELRAGANVVTLDDNGGWSPDIDKLEVVAVEAPGEDPGAVDGIGEMGAKLESATFGTIVVETYERGLQATNGVYRILYNTESGLAAYAWNGRTVAKGVFSTVRLDGLLESRDYEEHAFSLSDVERIKDGHGKGIRFAIENRQEGFPVMKQIYQIYDGLPYFLASQSVAGAAELRTNEMAPIVLNAKGGVDIGAYGDNRVLVTPFDNDMWSRYQARTINTSLNTNNYISSEVTAVYDNESRDGLVVGSVTHDLWKTGIAWSGSNDRLDKLKVYGGFASQASTHDSLPHGEVSGTTVTSPQMFVGFYDDYRDGLESYGRANAAVAAPLKFERGVPKGVPVGWNSWGAYDSKLSYDKVVAVSDFYKNNLQEEGFSNKGNVYINLDSYWDNLTDRQLKDVVSVIRNNGQKAGIYYGPFVYWGDNMEQPVEGTDGQYTYGDIILRDPDGNPLPKVDGAYAVDPTHPGAKQRIDYYFKRFLDYGFEYIKIDFLSHGSFEGAHYDPNVETGIEAYNQGMAHINEALDGRMFISASIAPLFPSQYAHARRISCDVDGTLAKTEYQLNNLTYGWWQNGTIYTYTDPDYMTLAKGGSFEAAQSRVNAAAISGTVFLGSDDVADPVAQQYMRELLTNERVNEVALEGEAFRPIEGDTGTAAADAFALSKKKRHSIAVFNYSNDPATKTIELARADIPASGTIAIDLWTQEQHLVTDGKLTIDLKGGQSKLLVIETKE